jgi:hypothetical protein
VVGAVVPIGPTKVSRAVVGVVVPIVPIKVSRAVAGAVALHVLVKGFRGLRSFIQAILIMVFQARVKFQGFLIRNFLPVSLFFPASFLLCRRHPLHWQISTSLRFISPTLPRPNGL